MLVQSVDSAGPAATAGLQVGDVVVDLNGAPVADMGALIVDARMLEPGDEASLRVWRSEKLMLLTVKVGELD